MIIKYNKYIFYRNKIIFPFKILNNDEFIKKDIEKMQKLLYDYS